MLRFLGLFCALLLFSATISPAEIIRCRTPDGRQVFTDDPTQVPPNCTPVTDQGNRGTMNIMPAYQPPPGTPPAEDSISQGNSQDQLMDMMQARAEALVNTYDDAQQQRYNSVIAEDQRLAIQKIEQVKADKRKLLDELDRSPLDQQNRETIQQTLARIPDS